MRVTLSERQFCEQIRSLEGLSPATTTEEIFHRIAIYARRLFDHLKNYGITMLDQDFQVNGSLCTISAALERSYTDEDRQTRLNGLAMLVPVSVDMQREDVGAFFEGIARTAMYDSWDSYAHEVQRVTVTELSAALERIAEKIMFAPVPVRDDGTPPEIAAVQQEQDFQMFLARAGKRDPLAKHRQIDQYEQAEIARVEAAKEAAYERFRNG